MSKLADFLEAVYVAERLDPGMHNIVKENEDLYIYSGFIQMSDSKGTLKSFKLKIYVKEKRLNFFIMENADGIVLFKKFLNKKFQGKLMIDIDYSDYSVNIKGNFSSLKNFILSHSDILWDFAKHNC